MEQENKRFGQVREIPTDVEKTRTIRFLASDDSVDRHGTVINMDNWDLESFRGNPIIGWQHNVYGGSMCSDPDPDQIIGKGALVMEDRKLFIDITFEDAENNALAEKIFRKVAAGILNAVSVGFIETGEGRMGDEKRGQNPEVYYFESQELLEVSVVSIPSNKNALKKSLRSQTYDALKYIYRELGGKFRFSEIEDMKVKDVISMMESDDEPERSITEPVKVNYKFIKKIRP
jgi:HK97 family phage prohead protease